MDRTYKLHSGRVAEHLRDGERRLCKLFGRGGWLRGVIGTCFHLAYSDVSFLGQAVPETAPAILGQAVPGTGPGSIATASTITITMLELLAAVPWGQHLQILKKVADTGARLYYLRATARFGWSRNVLLHQIKAGAYERAVTEKKTHNFPLALPEYLAEQADQVRSILPEEGGKP